MTGVRSRSLVCLSLLCSSLAPPAAGQAPSSANPAVDPAVDVALHESGVLVGQLVSADGQPIGDTEVRLRLPDGRSASAQTDAGGAFAFRGATGAAYLSAPGAEQVVRAWSPMTAPPSASRGVLLVQGDTVARGQRRASPELSRLAVRSKKLWANPVFIASAAAAAIAIPVALHNDDDRNPATN